MDKKLIESLISETPTPFKLQKVRELISIDEVHEINISFKQSNNSKLNFVICYYDNEKEFSYFIVFQNPKGISKDINEMLSDAKKIYDLETTPISLNDVDTTINKYELYADSLRSAETEEKVAEIFDNDLNELKTFMRTSYYANLLPDLKAFVFGISEDPFTLLWTTTE